MNEKEKQELLDEITKLKNQNANLLRMHREMVNKEQNLSKKNHTGYIAVISKLITSRHNISGKIIEYVYWKTTFQTPYSTDISFEIVKEQIQTDFFESFKKEEPLGILIGIKYINCTDYKNLETSQKAEENTVFKISFIADFKKNCWILEISHTLPIKGVPAEMRIKR